ncbi:MAG: RecQ family zinc-binding domain-containing protein, partial [Flammeovirgaceae bacterium]|nr:RecQ family zinc-binding domain-containing protein [Flammeovirgaceae bacterium]MDW8288774.1 RecQ family zinc-binding domain-containing protein [Flammeovirgaceae bacterium]
SKLMVHLQGEELYKFQVAYPVFDALFKSIMRLYGGEVFSQMTSIVEGQIARMAQYPENKVKELLSELHKGEVITYQPRKEKPQLLFLKERLPAQRILTDTKRMNERKKLLKEKIDSVVHYLTHPLRCRTALLCAYFGEEIHNGCGVCDNCINQRKKESERDLLRKNIKQQLQHNPTSLETLISGLSMKNKEETIECVRRMLDEQEIVLREDGFLEVKK